MYTSGHTEILYEAMKRIDPNITLRKYLRFHGWKHVSLKTLLQGLKYPDFPCGKFRYTSTGRILMTKDVCSLLKLVDDIVIIPNIFSQSYSSHNGYFSVWHSMTYDPQRSVQDVTQDVVDIIMAACKLSLLDDEPNAFWIGFALHTIMDSYSPAHVTRVVKDEKPTAMQASSIESKETEQIGVLSKMRHIVSTQQTHTVEAIHNIVDKLALDSKIRSPSIRKDMKQLATFFAWHNQEMRDINKIRTVFNKTKIIMASFPDPTPLKLSSNQPLIVQYLYYPAQNSWFHKQNDFLISAKYAGYLEPCIRDCAVILQLYHTALHMIHNDPDAKLEIAYVFLRRIYKYLTYVTYKVHAGA